MIDLINRAKTIGIISHVNSDGDSIGSSMGLYLSLKELGKDVYIIKNSDIPSHLKFLPHLDELSERDPFGVDLLILLDLNEGFRTGNIGMEWIKRAKEIMCIDHHHSKGETFKYSYIDREASSTSQLVSKFIRDNNLPINKDISTFLYTGITTDTNRYMFNNSRKEAMEESIYLMENGADVNRIYMNVYNNRKMNEFKFANALFERGKFFYGDQGIILYISRELLDEYGISKDDTGFVKSMIMEFEQIKLAVIINENEDGYKVSLRSKIDVNVSNVASKFGGGGHVKASGFSMKKEDINLAMKKIKKRMEEEIYK